jgi:hypothetical protein
MFLEDFYKIVEIPGSFRDLITLFCRAVKEPVDNRELSEAFEQGLQEAEDGWENSGRSLHGVTIWYQVLGRLVHEGFIQDIFYDPCFRYKDILSGNDTDPLCIDVVKTQEPLPFKFISNSFAGVPQTKVI